jgi:O-acetyl-ADP-ribose deacetylase (regulator of RNase III)
MKGENSLSVAELVYKNTKITVLTGNITKLEVDAIVNPANSQLLMGGGVAGAILRAGGEQIQEQAVEKAPVPIGKAVPTTAGKLKAKHVIHAPTMTRPAMATNLEHVRAATRAALECAQQLRTHSLAFPGLGTGVGGVNTQEAANAMMEEVKLHIVAGTTIEQIIFVGYDQELTRAFQSALRKLK